MDSDDAYSEAKEAGKGLAWRTAAVDRGWDVYVFDGGLRLEMFTSGNQLPGSSDSTLDLRESRATDIQVNFFPRSLGAVNNTDMLGRYGHQFVIGAEVQNFNASLQGDHIRELGISLDQPAGSAKVRVESTNSDYQTNVSVAAPSSTEFSVEGASFMVRKSDSDDRSVLACDAGVSFGDGAKIGRLQVRGRCSLSPAPEGTIGLLTVEPGSIVSLGYDGDKKAVRTHVGNIEMAESVGTGSPSSFALVGFGELVAVTAGPLGVVLPDRQSTLVVEKTEEAISATGRGQLRIGSFADGLSFPAGHKVRLAANPRAVIRNVTGSVRLADVRYAEINGARRRGFEVVSIEPSDDVKKPTDGLILRNFRIPIEMSGMQTIRTLADTAAVAAPQVHRQLPGRFDERWLERRPGRVDDEFRADYARAIAQLAESGGAPGSSVTKLAWLESRMRHATSRNWEYCTLWVYRALGYGERAIPALATYVVLAMVLSAFDLHRGGLGNLDWSHDGIARYGNALGGWLMSPFHVLRLGSQEGVYATENNWNFLARVLLALPFLTGALSLRKYVKRTREKV